MKNARCYAFLLLICGSIVFGPCALPAATPQAVGRALGSIETGSLAEVHCVSKIEAYIASLSYAAANGGSVVITSGTPSMRPLIQGQTYVVVQKRPYGSIEKRDLLVYMGRPNAAKPDRVRMLHRAVMHDREGWLMSGDNNRWSESWDRVTPQTYVGTVTAIFKFPTS